MDAPADHVFPRRPGVALPVAVAGDGAEVIDRDGRRWLDGSGGAFVAILGHSPRAVAEAVAAQALRLNFAYSGDFANAPQSDLAAKLAAVAPPGLSKVWLTTSGSTATEAALKLARQYHLSKGRPERTRLIAREHSYHGGTLGALSLTGSQPRRRPYAPYLLDAVTHVAPPYCYRCPLGLTRPACGVACADEVARAVERLGPDTVSAVFVEPVAGAPLGALVTPPDYLRRVREICDAHDILMVADEVVSGLGRTGRWLAIEQSGVAPDVITLAKGLGGGFVPIGALIVHDKVTGALAAAGSSFVHGESFTGHILMGAAGAAVIDCIRDDDLLARVAASARRLEPALEALRASALVGDRRGAGLLHGLELVRDKASRAPFPRSMQVAERVAAAAARRGVVLLTGAAGADGHDGDTVMIAPPYVITPEQIDRLVAALRDALAEVAAEVA